MLKLESEINPLADISKMLTYTWQEISVDLFNDILLALMAGGWAVQNEQEATICLNELKSIGLIDLKYAINLMPTHIKLC